MRSEDTKDPRPVRVMVVDDHAIARSGIVALLAAQSDVEVVCEADSGIAAFALFEAHRPDVVVMDYRMPGLNGADSTRKLLQYDSSANILILTHHDSDEAVHSALQAGAKGFIGKDCDAASLVSAVKSVAQGKRFMLPAVAGRYSGWISRPSVSERERNVLALMASGKTNAEIGEMLGVSTRTAAGDVSSLLKKLEAKSRAELVAIAGERGLLSED